MTIIQKKRIKKSGFCYDCMTTTKYIYIYIYIYYQTYILDTLLYYLSYTLSYKYSNINTTNKLKEYIITIGHFIEI